MVPAFTCISFGGAQLVCNHLFYEFELGSAGKIPGMFCVKGMSSLPLNPTVPPCGLTGFGAQEQEEDRRTHRISQLSAFLLVFLTWL